MYASALTYASSNQVHKFTKNTSFELVLNRPPANIFLYLYVVDYLAATRETRGELLKRMDIAVQRAHDELEAAQERCKRGVDNCVRRDYRRISASDYLYTDRADAYKNLPRLHLKCNALLCALHYTSLLSFLFEFSYLNSDESNC